MSLFAALNPKTGAVIGQTATRHTSKEFVDFLQQVVSTCPAEQDIHIILDNLQVHKTALVQCPASITFPSRVADQSRNSSPLTAM
ncbi:MAG: transposase [Bryobacterales bacterium]|nr:transposase [Bryobacterales bacterium]